MSQPPQPRITRCGACRQPGHNRSTCQHSVCPHCQATGHSRSTCPVLENERFEERRALSELAIAQAIEFGNRYRAVERVVIPGFSYSNVNLMMLTPLISNNPGRFSISSQINPQSGIMETIIQSVNQAMTFAEVMEYKKIEHEIVDNNITCDVCYEDSAKEVRFKCSHGMCIDCTRKHAMSVNHPQCHMCREPLSRIVAVR